MEKYNSEREKRWKNAPIYERIADVYLNKIGFIIKINPIHQGCACDRHLYKNGEIIAGLEYKAKNNHPYCLLLDDKVFANLILKAYEQRIPRKELYIAYYHPKKIEDDWIIFSVEDLLIKGLCKRYPTEYKSGGVEVYEINLNHVPYCNQHQLYKKLYRKISLVDFLKNHTS